VASSYSNEAPPNAAPVFLRSCISRAASIVHEASAPGLRAFRRTLPRAPRNVLSRRFEAELTKIVAALERGATLIELA
jgi:hypothetical protein